MLVSNCQLLDTNGYNRKVWMVSAEQGCTISFNTRNENIRNHQKDSMNKEIQITVMMHHQGPKKREGERDYDTYIVKEQIAKDRSRHRSYKSHN